MCVICQEMLTLFHFWSLKREGYRVWRNPYGLPWWCKNSIGSSTVTMWDRCLILCHITISRRMKWCVLERFQVDQRNFVWHVDGISIVISVIYRFFLHLNVIPICSPPSDLFGQMTGFVTFSSEKESKTLTTSRAEQYLLFERRKLKKDGSSRKKGKKEERQVRTLLYFFPFLP